MQETNTTAGDAANSDAQNLQIETTRFGPIDIAADRVIHFASGLLGFPTAKRFALIQTDAESTIGEAGVAGEEAADCFFWLQSADDPRLAFVVCDPSGFLPEFADYGPDSIPLRSECRQELGFAETGSIPEAAQVLVICNRVGDWLTGNLLGPLVINGETFAAKQIVLTERRWGTRQPLLRLAATAGHATAGRIEPASTNEQPLRKTA